MGQSSSSTRIAGAGGVAQTLGTGALRVIGEATPLFSDTFDGAIDTTNLWTNIGTAPFAITNGRPSAQAGTTASASSRLRSQATFGVSSGHTVFSALVNTDAGSHTNIYRFFGFGQEVASPTYYSGTTTPSPVMLNGIGFESNSNGNFYAIVYANGRRFASSALNVGGAFGGLWRYSIVRRSDYVFFFVDDASGQQFSNLVWSAQVSGPWTNPSVTGPFVQTLPVMFSQYNNSTAPTGTVTFEVESVYVSDTAATNRTTSDGTYPWRRARVGANGDQVVSVSSPNAAAAGIFAQVNAYGALRVSPEPSSQFFDPFDSGTLDTTNLWVTSGTAFSSASGAAVSGTGTTASATSRLRSIPTFVSPGLGFSIFASVLTVEAAPVANTYRYWGFGNEGGSPAYQAALAASSTAIQNGVGFELDTAGNLYAVIYNAGNNVYRSTAIPTALWSGGTQHRYAIFKRSDVVFWYVEGQEAPVASVSYRGAAVQAQSVLFGQYNSSTAPSASTFQISAVNVSDSTSASTQISDGVFPFRKATVGASGGLAIRGGTLPVDTTSVAAGATQTRTAINAAEAGNVTFIIKPTAAGTPWTGNPVIVFEQSDDNSSWAPLTVVSSAGAVYNGSVSLGAGTAFVAQMFDAGLEGINFVRWRVTTAPSTAAMTVTTQLGTLPFEPAVALASPVPVAATSTVATGTAAAAAAATATTATPPSGQFVYVTAVSVTAYAGAAVTGAATPVVTTATNVPGPIFTFATAKAIGTSETQTMMFPIPIRSNAAVSITGPATTGFLWRVNISYYIGP